MFLKLSNKHVIAVDGITFKVGYYFLHENLRNFKVNDLRPIV